MDRYRVKSGPLIEYWGTPGDETCGAFLVPMDKQARVRLAHFAGITKIAKCIISGSEGWDHVSISFPDRCPTWEEMEGLKRLFFEPDAVCMQLHVGVAEHLSHHPFCLHIWHPHGVDIPLPPPEFVAMPSAKKA